MGLHGTVHVCGHGNQVWWSCIAVQLYKRGEQVCCMTCTGLYMCAGKGRMCVA
jgi:hypothetical protein